MAWIDVKKACDSVDRGCLNKVMLLHRFPVWLPETLDCMLKPNSLEDQ